MHTVAIIKEFCRTETSAIDIGNVRSSPSHHLKCVQSIHNSCAVDPLKLIKFVRSTPVGVSRDIVIQAQNAATWKSVHDEALLFLQSSQITK